MCPEFLDLIQKMLVLDADKRITVKEALDHSFFKLPKETLEQEFYYRINVAPQILLQKEEEKEESK